MRPSSKLYGVLRADQSKDVTRESKHYLTTVIVVPSPKGDGTTYELITTMNERGSYEIHRRNSKGKDTLILTGNVIGIGD